MDILLFGFVGIKSNHCLQNADVAKNVSELKKLATCHAYDLIVLVEPLSRGSSTYTDELREITEAPILTVPSFTDLEQLVVRTQTFLRTLSLIRTGKITLNVESKTVEVDGRPVHLTSKEYQVFEFLSLNKGSIVTRDMLLDHLYGGLIEPDVKIIDVFISKLRKKLAQATAGPHYIRTVRQRGYILQDPT